MSVERIQPIHNVKQIKAGIWETDSSTLKLGQNPYQYKFGCDMLNLQSANLKRKTLVAESEIEKQHEFDVRYHKMMQKLEIEIQRMKRHLGSLDLKENVDKTHGLPTESIHFKDRQTRQRNTSGMKHSARERDQCGSTSYGALGYKDERLQGLFTGVPNTTALGPLNFRQSDNGERLTSKSEKVMRDVNNLYNLENIGDDNEDVSLSYNHLTEFVNSYDMPWEEKILEQQKFKAELFKTEMCRSWAKFGLCPYANSCRFAHGYRELRMKPKPHWKYKTEMCKKFLAGFCPYGSRCSFVHMPYQEYKSMNRQRSLGSTVYEGNVTGQWHRNPFSRNPRRV